eukprot:gb/GECG01006654.1/.p1 GENE.gb/GECG01006654.1/~~gb/GECG01006654.1/.p1  ORF type:complete len:702 (+),score=73.63 gb/GECG01006654.1/:1-2106(+)
MASSSFARGKLDKRRVHPHLQRTQPEEEAGAPPPSSSSYELYCPQPHGDDGRQTYGLEVRISSQTYNQNRRGVRLRSGITARTGQRSLFRGKSTLHINKWSDESLTKLWTQYVGSAREAIQCALVCKTWASAIFDHDLLWQRLYAQQYLKLRRGIRGAWEEDTEDARLLLSSLPAFTRADDATLSVPHRQDNLEWDADRPIPLFGQTLVGEHVVSGTKVPGSSHRKESDDVEMDTQTSFRLCRWYSATLSLIHCICGVQIDIVAPIRFSSTPARLESDTVGFHHSPVDLYPGIIADFRRLESEDDHQEDEQRTPFENLGSSLRVARMIKHLYSHVGEEDDHLKVTRHSAERSYSFQRSPVVLRDDPDVLLIGCSHSGKDTITRASTLKCQAWKNEAWLSEKDMSNQWRHFHRSDFHGVACTLGNRSGSASLLVSAYQDTKHFEGNMAVIDCKADHGIAPIIEAIDTNFTFLMEWKLAHLPTVILANKQDSKKRITPLQLAFLWGWRAHVLLDKKLKKFDSSPNLIQKRKSLVELILRWHSVSGSMSLIGFGLDYAVCHFKDMRVAQFDWSWPTEKREELFNVYNLFNAKYRQRLHRFTEVVSFFGNKHSKSPSAPYEEDARDNQAYAEEISSETSSVSSDEIDEDRFRDRSWHNRYRGLRGVHWELHGWGVSRPPRSFDESTFLDDETYGPLRGLLVMDER